MKKLILLAACSLLLAAPAQAQLGNLMKAAAKKAAQKVVDKTVDKAAEAATNAVQQSLGLDQQQQQQEPQADPQTNQTAADPSAPLTYDALLAQMPALPTARQLASYKEAELNEATLRLLTNPVTTFNAKVLSLSMQALSLAYAGVDSAAVTEGAYKLAESTTGLSRQEIDKLATMSDEEQEAYLAAHYAQGTAEANLLRNAATSGTRLARRPTKFTTSSRPPAAASTPNMPTASPTPAAKNATTCCCNTTTRPWNCSAPPSSRCRNCAVKSSCPWLRKSTT